MKVTFLFSFLIWTLFGLQAQSLPIIVKDYKQCTVGLQDAKGNWITPPVYTDIRPFDHGLSVALRSGYYCVLDASGKERIPAIYNNISFVEVSHLDNYSTSRSLRRDLYHCKSNNRTTIIDTAGKTILDVAMTLFTFNYDNQVTARDSTGRWHIVWLNGKVVDLPTEIRTEPLWQISGLYRVDMRTKTNRTGVIDSAGRFVVPAEYDRAIAYHTPYSTIRADKEGSAYYFTTEGKLIAECESKRYNLYSNPFEYGGMMIVENNTRFGIVNWKGDTVLPLVYDSAPLIMGVHNFIVQQNGKYAAVTDSTYLHPTVTYDLLLPVTDYYGGRVPNNHFFAKTESGWNMLDANGHPYFMEGQDTFLNTYQQILFVKDKDIVHVHFEWYGCAIGLTEEMYKMWEQKLYTGGPIYYGEGNPRDTSLDENYLWYDWYQQAQDADSIKPYRMNRKKPPVNPYPYLLRMRSESFPAMSMLDTVDSGVPGYTVYVAHEEQYNGDRITAVAGMTATDSSGTLHFYTPVSQVDNLLMLTENRNSTLVTQAGKIMVKPGPYTGFTDTHDSSGIIIAYNHHQHVVLIDSTGDVLYDTHTNLFRFLGHGLMWLGDSVKDPLGRQTCTVVWKLYNYNERRYTLDSSLQITQTFRPDGSVQQIKTLHGTGLIATDHYRMIVPPVYGEIVSLDKLNRFYAVRTCKKFGMMNSSGQLILDTIYNGYTQMMGAKLYQPAADVLRASDLFLFFNHTDSLALFYGNGTINRIDTSEHDLMLHVMEDAYRMQWDYTSTCLDCNTQLNHDTDAIMNKWQREFIYHHVFDSCRGTYPQMEGYKSDFNRCACQREFLFAPYPYNSTGLQSVTIHHTEDSLLAFDNHFSGNKLSSYHVYYNILLTSRGPVELTLDSLFTGKAWRQIISDSVLAYLKAHPGINADCSHPEMYPELLKKRFVLDQNGLSLYPEWSWQTDRSPLPRRPEIVIPWSTLEPHLRADIKRKLGIP